MALPRRLLTFAALVVVGAVFAAPSFGAPPPGYGAARGAGSCGGFPFTLGSQHFLVHYFSDVSDTSCDSGKAITETQAGDILGYAEQAYTEELGTYGFPSPPADGALGGDARWDIYVVNMTGTGAAGTAWPDGAGPSTSGSFDLDAHTGITPEVISHEFFHVVQFGMWLPAQPDEYWLLESTAEWMAAKINNYAPRFVTDLGPSDMALDCKDPLGTNKCDLSDGYANGAYSRWPFWQSVTTLYGPQFVKEVFLQGAGNPAETAVKALSDALAARGSNLADTFTNWTVQQMTGGYGLDVLDQVKPKVWKVVDTGIVSQTLPRIDVPVNHLATRFVEFDRGNGSGGGSCFAATLTLTVTIPAGVASKPSFYWNGLNSAPVQLAISGSTATAAVPWDTCTWLGNQAYLNLPNPDTDPTHNGQLFRVTARIDVDTKTPGQAASPPDPAAVNGPVVPVPSTVAPTVKAFGPELLRLSGTTPVVRLILQSSGEGSVIAALGGTSLGSADLRPGNNDVRFALPKSLLPRLRRAAAAGSNLLTLTPVSPSGAKGTPVTRKVLIAGVKQVVKKAAKAPAPKKRLKRR